MIDIAIIDRVTNEILSIFELKIMRGNSGKSLLKQAENQLCNYLSKLENPEIPAYLVISNISKGDKDFEIFPFEIGDDGKRSLLQSPITMESLPSYTTLSNSSRSSAIDSNEKKRKKTTNWFWGICWFCATVTALLVVLEGLDCISISTTQLSLIGATIALIIIPFSKKLKILGIEFEQLTEIKPNK